MSFPDSKDLPDQALRRLAEQLIGEVAWLGWRLAAFGEENRAFKNNVARLKSQKERPKLIPSGMKKDTDRQKSVVNEVQKLKVPPPARALQGLRRFPGPGFKA